jgi:SPRY domain-containing SOCS box protein 1/4
LAKLLAQQLNMSNSKSGGDQQNQLPQWVQAMQFAWERPLRWNRRSHNYFVAPWDEHTIVRRPKVECTDAALAGDGFSRGVHLFRFHWAHRQRGTHAAIGVGTVHSPLYASKYVSLVGAAGESWGWNLTSLADVSHDTLLMVLDCDTGTLRFGTETHLFAARCKLPRCKLLFPMVSCVWGRAQHKVQYLGNAKCQLPTLKRLAATAVKRHCAPLQVPQFLHNEVFRYDGVVVDDDDDDE